MSNILAQVLALMTAPPAHKVSHQDGGADEISVGGLSGVLADPQPPIIGGGGAQAVAGNDVRLTNARTPTAHTHPESDIVGLVADLLTLATAIGLKVDTTDPRLSDARPPTAHAASHQALGLDAIKLDDLAAPDDNTDLNASILNHGLLPKLSGLSGDGLRGDGTWAAIPGGSDLSLSKLAPTGDNTVSAGYSAYVSDYYEITAGKYLEAGVGAVMEVG